MNQGSLLLTTTPVVPGGAKSFPFFQKEVSSEEQIFGVHFFQFGISLGVHWCESVEHGKKIQRAFKDWKKDFGNRSKPLQMSETLHQRPITNVSIINKETVEALHIPKSFIALLRDRGL